MAAPFASHRPRVPLIALATVLLTLALVIVPGAGAITPSVTKVTPLALSALSCPTTTQCTAVDRNNQPGSALPSPDAHAVTFNPLAPSTATTITAAGQRLFRVSCPTTHLCASVGFGYAGVSTFDPTSSASPVATSFGGSNYTLHDLACPSASQCTAITGDGAAYTFNPGAPGPTVAIPVVSDETGQSGGSSVVRVRCPSTTQCSVADSTGRIATFNPAAPVLQTPAKVSNVPFYELDCPSTAQCTGLAQDPYGGPAYDVTFNPAAPGTPASLPVSPLSSAMSCPAVTQCTASAGQAGYVTFDPRTPGTPTPRPPAIGALSGLDCPTVTQCTGVDFNGNAATFDPTPAATPTPTPAKVSVAAGKTVAFVVAVPGAKPGSKVAATLTGRTAAKKALRRKATLKVTAEGGVAWKVAHLPAGSYAARFVSAGKTVKTIRITVRRKR